MATISANIRTIPLVLMAFKVAAALPMPGKQPTDGHPLDVRVYRLAVRDEDSPDDPDIVWLYILAGVFVIFLVVIYFVLRPDKSQRDAAKARRKADAEKKKQARYVQDQPEGHTEGHVESCAEPARPVNARLASAWRFVWRARNGAPDKPEGVEGVEGGGVEMSRIVTNQRGAPDKPM